MAPLRNRTIRTQNDQDQALDGLPVRHWKQLETTVGVPPEQQTSAKYSHWPELPMPRDSHLLSDMSRQLLRIARMPRISKPNGSAEDDEKDPAEEEETKVDTRGFTIKRWALMAKGYDDQDREYLAKRRKGLPPMHDGYIPVYAIPGQTQDYRNLRVEKFDAEGNSKVYDVMAPVGQAVEGEILEPERAAAATVEAARPGTVIEGIGVVNADGIVVAQATPRRKAPPPPRPKKKKGGPGRSKKKIVPELGPDGVPIHPPLDAMGNASSDLLSADPGTEGGDTPMGDAGDEDEGSDEGEEMDVDEEKKENGEVSTHLTPGPSQHPLATEITPSVENVKQASEKLESLTPAPPEVKIMSPSPAPALKTLAEPLPDKPTESPLEPSPAAAPISASELPPAQASDIGDDKPVDEPMPIDDKLVESTPVILKDPLPEVNETKPDINLDIPPPTDVVADTEMAESVQEPVFNVSIPQPPLVEPAIPPPLLAEDLQPTGAPVADILQPPQEPELPPVEVNTEVSPPKEPLPPADIPVVIPADIPVDIPAFAPAAPAVLEPEPHPAPEDPVIPPDLSTPLAEAPEPVAAEPVAPEPVTSEPEKILSPPPAPVVPPVEPVLEAITATAPLKVEELPESVAALAEAVEHKPNLADITELKTAARGEKGPVPANDDLLGALEAHLDNQQQEALGAEATEKETGEKEAQLQESVAETEGNEVAAKEPVPDKAPIV